MWEILCSDPRHKTINSAYPNNPNFFSTIYGCIHVVLPYQVKTQYLQILDIIDTSIKRAIANFRSIPPMVKGCINLMFDMVDTAFGYREHWSSANFFENLPRLREVVCMEFEMQILRFNFVGQSSAVSFHWIGMLFTILIIKITSNSPIFHTWHEVIRFNAYRHYIQVFDNISDLLLEVRDLQYYWLEFGYMAYLSCEKCDEIKQDLLEVGNNVLLVHKCLVTDYIGIMFKV